MVAFTVSAHPLAHVRLLSSASRTARRILSWQDAHVGFEKAVEGLAPNLRGVRAEGFPHSAWEIVEHLRLTQHDILDFCRNPKYEELNWPDGGAGDFGQ